MGQICRFFLIFIYFIYYLFIYIYYIKPEGPELNKKNTDIFVVQHLSAKKSLYLVSLILRYYSFVYLIKSEHKKGQICLPWYKYVHVDKNGNYISSYASKQNCNISLIILFSLSFFINIYVFFRWRGFNYRYKPVNWVQLERDRQDKVSNVYMKEITSGNYFCNKEFKIKQEKERKL